jgi:hypothetical protein
MSLGLIPLVLFLLSASREDVRNFAIRRVTVLLWSAVAVVGWWSGAWSLDVYGIVICGVMLWLAGTGRGDRYGGALMGGLMGPDAVYAITLALAGALLVSWYRDRPTHALALYPFLLAGVSSIIGYRIIEGYLKGT